MRRLSSKPWNLKLNEAYTPRITVLLPTYNEEDVIELKLENLANLQYPKNSIQTILVDSASTDNTTQRASKFHQNHPEMNMEILKEEKRRGKSVALNFALKYATGEVIVVSDADSFLPPNILTRVLPHLADPSVGAISGKEVLLNSNQSWITNAEASYRDSVSLLRVGESKFYSTIFFEGGFSAYKREFLSNFDSETGCDDSGTAFNLVQAKTRTILLPDANFFTAFPPTWQGMISIKTRRASQLVRIWIKSLILLLKNKLQLPKRIALPEIFLHVFNPAIFILLVLTTILLLMEQPLLLVVVLSVLLIPKTRRLLLKVMQDNFILVFALIAFALNRRFAVWSKASEARHGITRELLKNAQLI
jgi:cellulose synthase/poly-beta-1,6-N-acetylglucosamine synthase-like glycosyltransferase